MEATLNFTSPVFVPEDGVYFSLYGVGRGYHAFLLSVGAACQKLGAQDSDSKQVLLAFKLNLPRIARAIDGMALPADGRRAVLDSESFA